jgi:ADP-heptose:LPS heptosyltransferase
MTSWPELRWALGLAWRVVLDSALLAILRAPPATSRGAGVCIVRVDGIGDFVLWMDACRRLLARYRGEGSRVTLVADSLWASWARELGLADEVWEFDRKRFISDVAYRAQWIGKMRAAAFSCVLQPTHSRRPDQGDALVRASGAPRRIGS